MFRKIAFALSLLLAPPALAQSAIDCHGWQGAARNIVEPWEANIRTFANGNIRVALLDTVEPAAGAFYLLILAPPYDELGNRTCALIAEGDGSIGFAGLFFAQLGATYDPSTGLVLRLPVTRYAPATGGTDPAILAVAINQAAGTITPWFEIP